MKLLTKDSTSYTRQGRTIVFFLPTLFHKSIKSEEHTIELYLFLQNNAIVSEIKEDERQMITRAKQVSIQQGNEILECGLHEKFTKDEKRRKYLDHQT